MGNRLIFVSCGQDSDAEKALGAAAKAAIEVEEGFDVYLAQSIQGLDGIGESVLNALMRCSGAVVFLQNRGKVIGDDGSVWGHRSSLWVNQEVAILAYRQHHEQVPIPILAFKDSFVRLEGALMSLVVNPASIPDPDKLGDTITEWLKSNSFSGGLDGEFRNKWQQLSHGTRRVTAALLALGGREVKVGSVRSTLRQTYGIPREEAAALIRDAKLEFIRTDLVKLIKNPHSGDEMSVHPTWEFELKRAVTAWKRAD
jgi:hypothetical protein